MKFANYLFLLFLLLCCNDTTTDLTSCELIDVGQVGTICDSLYSIGENKRAAQLYFQAGEANRSSELFVYSAWQFGEAGEADSALIAIKRAVAFGMNSPYILDKVGVEETSKGSVHRPEVDQLLEGIKHRNSSIDNFEIITTPMDRFWEYLDLAKQDTANAKRYFSAFICEGSAALRDYYHIRYENVDNIHEATMIKHPEYYRYLRNHISSESLQKVSRDAKKMMANFSELYPNAVFPKTYLLPDLLNSSGTLTELGLFVGVDMFAKSDSMPVATLNDWQLNTVTEFENMKFDLVHELMHFQQSYSDFDNRTILLGKLIEEGVCDFLVSLLTKDHQVSSAVQRNLDYLADPENRAFVLKELKKDLYGGDLSKWMYNGGGIQDRPSNLGYTMGFLICKSYYDNSIDKQEAIVELLNSDNLQEII